MGIFDSYHFFFFFSIILWVVKSKLCPRSGSVALRQLNPIHKKGGHKVFNPKTAGGSIWLSPVVFRKINLLKRVKPWFFVTFNIIISRIFPENFYWNSSSRSEIMKNLSVNISYFHRFSGFFWHFLVTKKLMTSVYNK